MWSSFTKIFLFSFLAISTAASAEPVTYVCDVRDGSLASFTLAFDQDWNNDSLPSFSSAATVTVADVGQNEGTATGQILGGRTRVTGLASIHVETTGSLGELELSLLEKSGHGRRNGHIFFLNCR